MQYVMEQFWSRWRKEYLANLDTRQKWPKSKRNLKVGDIVIIQEEAPRPQWPLGKIVEASRDEQGLSRTYRQDSHGHQEPNRKIIDHRKSSTEVGPRFRSY